MPKDAQLDILNERQQAAFERKQAAYKKYSEARDRANAANAAMQTAWNERVSARDAMNREYEQLQSDRQSYDLVWAEYRRVKDENGPRIDELRREADEEHRESQRCFQDASLAYECGNKAEAPGLAAEGREHRDRRDSLNAQVKELVDEIRQAKQRAEMCSHKPNSYAFHKAKTEFDAAKARHERLQAEYKEAKAERDRLKAEFEAAKAEHRQAQAAFKSRLEEVKRQRRNSERKAIDKVNMALVRTKPFELGKLFGHNAKVVPRNDGSGKTDVYYAGLAAAGDGMGHGHAVIDRDGNVTYLRDAWSDHNDYLINDRAKKGKPTHNI